MTGADRRRAAKHHWWLRGYADCLTAIADAEGWSDHRTRQTATRLGLDRHDLHHARRRADAYRQENP